MQFGDVLVIQLVSARNLIGVDWNGFSDPYCVFNVGGQMVRSSVKRKTLQPEWHENLGFWMSPAAPTSYLLSVMVHFDRASALATSTVI